MVSRRILQAPRSPSSFALERKAIQFRHHLAPLLTSGAPPAPRRSPRSQARPVGCGCGGAPPRAPSLYHVFVFTGGTRTADTSAPRPPRVARRQLTAAAPALTLAGARRAGGEVADPARGSLLANLTPPPRPPSVPPRDPPLRTVSRLPSLAAHCLAVIALSHSPTFGC
ncbi:hypothetical protein K1T71_008971 [Dendrolimus kikuchii]|uniref:Uncharacterized protein n=1 Tax=Dendrolimus kikuchii TaxID=765133 RepID=A0ACC1CX15_9NEOP|nr:hypothetical protein K1T71_008971 [Dendrolimus kikuchii]